MKKLINFILDSKYYILIYVILLIPRLSAAIDSNSTYVAQFFYIVIAMFMVLTPDKIKYGMVAPKSMSSLVAGIFGLIGLYAVSFWVIYLVFNTTHHNWHIRILELIQEATGSTNGFSFFFIGVIGFCLYTVEEFYFRGLLFSCLTDKFGERKAIVIAAFLWAIAHIGIYGLNPFDGYMMAGIIICVFFMGIGLGWIRVATKSVYACVISQAVANSLLLFWTHLVFQW